MTSTKQSSSLVTSTLVVLLTLVGIALLVMLHTKKVSQSVRSMMDVVVELDSLTSDTDTTDILLVLRANNYVLPNSVEFISKEQALRTMQDQLVDIQLEENPFDDVITFNVKPEYYSEEVLEKMKTALYDNPVVSDMHYQSDIGSAVSGIMRKLSLCILVLAVMIGYAAFVLIRNMLRLQLDTDRQKIATMQMVGASNQFILKPYLRSAVAVSLRASIISMVLLTALVMGAVSIFSANYQIVSWLLITVAYVALTITAILVVFSVTLNVVREHLSSNRR